MNPRTSATMAMLAASMLAASLYTDSLSRQRARSERVDPHTPLTTREKQAKNRAKRKRSRK